MLNNVYEKILNEWAINAKSCPSVLGLKDSINCAIDCDKCRINSIKEFVRNYHNKYIDTDIIRKQKIREFLKSYSINEINDVYRDMQNADI
jgi:hypothetical protein